MGRVNLAAHSDGPMVRAIAPNRISVEGGSSACEHAIFFGPFASVDQHALNETEPRFDWTV
jgi:hypothetical protein